MKNFYKSLVLVLFLVFFTTSAYALSFGLNIDSLHFSSEEKEDILGAGSSTKADGKSDASFNLAVSGAQAIREISLKNETTGKVWSSSPSGSTDLLVVKDNNNNIINSSGRMPITPVILQSNFKLYINDSENAIPKDSDFTVKVTLIDSNEVTGKTSVKAVGKTKEEPTKIAKSDRGISLFEANGITKEKYDDLSQRVWFGKKNNQQFTLKLDFNNARVKAMRITAQTAYRRAEWNTTANNNLSIIAVIDSEKDLLNKKDGTIYFHVKGTSTYTLLLPDVNGILADPAMKAKITITLSDGRIFEKDAVKGSTFAQNETFNVEYKGTGKYDFVGSSEKIQSNLNADRQIDMSVNISGIVNRVRVKDVSSGKIWDTRAGDGNALVVLTDEKGTIQNKNDGTISMSLNGAKNLSLWFDEEDNRNDGPYLVTFIKSNGQIFEATTVKSVIDQPVITKEDRSADFATSKPALVNVDTVGKNKRLAGNGQNDTALNVKITGEGVVKALTLTVNNRNGWDTLAANNGRWLLGVRENSKVMNYKDGHIWLNVNGTKTYQLLLQDNGELRKQHGRVDLNVTWSDGKVTKTFLSW